MKILLVYPPILRSADIYSTPLPIGLLQVGGWLRDCGHEVRALNLELGGAVRTVSIRRLRDCYAANDPAGHVADPGAPFRAEFAAAMADFAPDLVGFSCATEQSDAAAALAADARAIRPGVRIEFGDLRRQPPTEWVREVSAAARDADAALDLLADQNPPASFGAVLTSLGCPHQCTFCGSPRQYGRKLTLLPVETVRRRIEQAVALGADKIHLMDDLMTVNPRRAREMADLMGEIGLPWRTQTRADDLVRHPELADYFKDRGCVQMTFGAESGSGRVLAMMKKRATPELFLRAAEVFDRVGMPYTANFMIGYPGETDDDVARTMELIESMGPRRVLAGSVVPYHGTELFESHPALAASAGRWPLCRWSPFDPTFLCDEAGGRIDGPSADAIEAFFGLVERINDHPPTAGTFSSILKAEVR